MAQLFKLLVLVAFICLLQSTVLSQPISASAGVGPVAAGGGLGGEAEGSGDVAAGALADGEVAAETASELAADGGTAATIEASESLNSGLQGNSQLGTNGVIGGDVGGITSAVLAYPNLLAQLAANKLATGMNAAQFATALMNGGAGRLGTGMGLAGIGGPNGAYLQLPAAIVGSLRDGALSAVDFGDQATGQMSANVGQYGLNGAGMIDNGLSVMGIRQPVAAPMVQAAWQTGEDGRQTGFEYGRQFLNGFAIPSSSFNLGGASNGGAGGVFGLSGLSSGPAAIQAEAEVV